MKRLFKGASLYLILLQILSVIYSSPSQAVTEVTIAFQGPLTGPESYIGIPELNGAKYAINKFNASSTQYKVLLTAIDDQGDPAVANTVSPSAALNSKIIGVIGPAYSGASRVSLPYFKSAGLVAISPSAGNVSLTDPSSNMYFSPVFHRTIGLNIGSPIAKHAIKGVSAPKVFLVESSDSYTSTQRDYVIGTLEALNTQLLATHAVALGTTDYTAPIAKIKATAANVVIFLGNSQDAAALIKQLRDSGYAGQFSAGNIDFGSDFATLAGKAAEGARVATNVLESISQNSSTLEADFKAVTGASSARYSIETIDATNIMLSCIGKGNIERVTLLKCIKAYKGKSFLGAEISFDSYGDISGYYSYVGEVKNSKIQFSDPIINEPIVRKLTESTEAEINLKSISARSIKPGENITWNFAVTVQPGWTKGIYLQIADPQGQIRYLNQDLMSRFKGAVVEKAETFDVDLVLQTHLGLLPGKYSVVNFCIEGTKRDCVTDPNYANTFNPNKQNRSVNLDEFSFEVKDTGDNLKETPLKISKITGRKNSYSPGEVIQYDVEATGKMTLGQANMSLSIGNNGVSAYCQPNYSSNCSYSQDKEKGITKIVFTFPIPEDLPAGKVELSSIYISSIGSSVTSNDSSVNSTANWNTAFNYSDKAIRADSGETLPTDLTFSFSALSATILDSGGEEKRPPTWSNLAWKSNKVNAGSEAILTLDLNGYNRYISAAYLYNLVSTSGNTIGLKDISPSIVSTDPTEGIYPLKKSGQYQIKVTIPRSASPGSYRLGQLTIEASNCSAKSPSEWIQKANSGTGQCSGLNSWQTTYYNGNLKSLSWPGAEKTSTLVLEILPAGKPQLPQLKVVSSEANTIKIDYPYDYEINCDFTSDKGSLIHQQVSKGQSNDGINHLIVSELKPDSVLKLSGSCIGIDGLKGESTTFEFKTAKPIPPAVPKVSQSEIGVESAKFDFVYREGFKYQVKSNSGQVTIGNGTLEFKGLSPDSRVEFQISITDPYSQTTTSDPIVFTTNRPNPPVSPTLILSNKSQTRVSVSTKFDPQYDYEVTSTSGTVSLVGSLINISGLKAGEQFTLIVTVKDKYQQSVTSKESFQAELPPAPRAPSLISKSILANEISLTVTQQEGTQLVIKSSAGVVSLAENLVKVTNLPPKSTVTLSAYLVDQFGQSSTVVTKSYLTRAAAPQKTLTCTNGKTTKIVIGSNPVCPAGFKKK